MLSILIGGRWRREGSRRCGGGIEGGRAPVGIARLGQPARRRRLARRFGRARRQLGRWPRQACSNSDISHTEGSRHGAMSAWCPPRPIPGRVSSAIPQPRMASSVSAHHRAHGLAPFTTLAVRPGGRCSAGRTGQTTPPACARRTGRSRERQTTRRAGRRGGSPRTGDGRDPPGRRRPSRRPRR